VQVGGRRDQQAELLERMNKRHAVVREGGKTRVLCEEWDPTLERNYLARSSFGDIRNFYHQPLVDVGEDESEPLGSWWLKHPKRRQYEGVIFSPGKDVAGYFNTWRGWAVEPRPGDWSLYQQHVLEIICSGNADHFEYVLAWLARGVQQPASRPEVAIVLISPERGTGKGFFAREYCALFGPHAIQISNSYHLVGNFNAHLEDACVLFLDEAFWAGDKKGEGVLKALITEPTLPVERKHHDVRVVRNCLSIIMASNSEWVIPAGLDERRFLVLDVDSKHKQDTVYFAALANQMENGGRAAMLYDLLRHDYSGVDLREAPQTKALLEQKLLSLSPRERWWFGKLMEGRLLDDDVGWVPEVSKAVLHENYVQELRQTGVRRATTEVELGMWLKDMLGSRLITSRPSQSGQRVRRWTFPPLQECRDLFDQKTGGRTEWPAPESAVARSLVARMPGAPR
jgi:hypothetical protein